jgi:hypothetical protein
MNASAALKRSYTWSTFAMLSAELSLEEAVHRDGGDWKTGLAVRIVDVDCSDVNPAVPKDITARIEQIYRHYGHAGPAFVRAMIAEGLHRPEKARELRRYIETLAERLANSAANSAGADATLRRAALPFAIVATAGGLASQFGILPPEIDVERAVKWAWARFCASGGIETLDPETKSIDNLRTFVAQNFDVTIRATTDDEAHCEAVGWYDSEAVYLPRACLIEASGGLLKETALAQALHARGFIVKQKDKEHYYVTYVCGVGKVGPTYALKRGEFGRP